MKLPIRDQILWPLTGLLLVAVTANAVFSALWMSGRNLRSVDARQRQIIGVLEESSFPLSANVLQKLRRLTGDEFVVWNSTEKRVVVETLDTTEIVDQMRHWKTESEQIGEPVRCRSGGKSYLVHSSRLRGTPSNTLFVLTSEDALRKASREVIWPPLAIGVVTLVLSILLTLLLASSWARRIRSLEQNVQTIAEGEFGHELPSGVIDDELARLVESINSMSRQLRSMREQLIQGERARLVAQLTAGFGHQLRNGLAGARLAIQLHESRCSSQADTSLAVARNQLALVEEEVQGLLSLGKEASRSPTNVDLVQIVQAVQNLISLSCDHKSVQLTIEIEPGVYEVLGFADRLRAGLLNLILNAIDATGPGGQIWLRLNLDGEQIILQVEDDGPGPPAEVAKSLFESFVTSKPEGIGLGLTVAATVVREHNGLMSWKRVDQRTRFEMLLPLATSTE